MSGRALPSTVAVPVPAAAVANAFLELGWKSPNSPPIDQMKLQKLVYYAHAWFLAIFEKPLIRENFEAWPWGPVVRDIYNQTMEYGRRAIDEPMLSLTTTGVGGKFDVHYTKPEITDEFLLNFINLVWISHRDFTGVQLSNSTHGPGEPWSIMLKHHKDLESKPTIPNDLIKDVFSRKFENGRNKNTPSE